MELRLGTVQFGLDYGILNQKKKPFDYCVDCLDYATQNGILDLDTAAAYGNAEEIVGAFIEKHTIGRDKLTISSKMKPNVLDEYKPEEYEKIIENHITNQLTTLHTDYLDAYLLHSARYAKRPEIIEALTVAKRKGYAKKIGVSVYEPDEAIACIDNPLIEFTQFPYSIFDHRMKNAGVFEKAVNSKIEIDTRSAFIQGLILMNEEQVPPFLSKAKPIVAKIDTICEKFNLNRVQLAMAYVKCEKRISHLVFGVDNKEQLVEDIKLFHTTNLSEKQVIEIGKEFEGITADIVMPSLWKK